MPRWLSILILLVLIAAFVVPDPAAAGAAVGSAIEALITFFRSVGGAAPPCPAPPPTPHPPPTPPPAGPCWEALPPTPSPSWSPTPPRFGASPAVPASANTESATARAPATP